MELKKNNRIKRVDVRLTEEEHKVLIDEFKSSNFTKFSAFLRSKLLSQPLTIEEKLQNEALLQAGKMNTTLSKLGTNFNQLVKGVNTYKNTNLTAAEKRLIFQIKDVVNDLLNIFNNVFYK